MKNILLYITMLLIIFCENRLHAAETVLADPDHVSTGYEYRGTADVRLGDFLKKNIYSFGGMIDIRNESRFNQKILPNHNWRGFVFAYIDKQLNDNLILTGGFEHESAHPTMGYNDGNSTAYDKIYDGTYRAMNLNSLMIRLGSVFGTGYNLLISGDAQFYFKSKNTPELPENDDLTWSEGLSCGFEFRYPVYENIELFFSGFDRYIFQSIKKTRGNIYYNTDSGVETRNENYPVINAVNTISFKTGIIVNSFIPSRKLLIYCGFLYGNIYGFVDSREKRTVYSIGIDLYH